MAMSDLGLSEKIVKSIHGYMVALMSAASPTGKLCAPEKGGACRIRPEPMDSLLEKSAVRDTMVG